MLTPPKNSDLKIIHFVKVAVSETCTETYLVSSLLVQSFSNNRIVAKALALGTFKAGSKGWDLSLGSIQDP